MRNDTRKLLDRSFSSLGMMSIVIMGLCLVVILLPIFLKGSSAYIFQATAEHRRLLYERFDRGDEAEFKAEQEAIRRAREPIYRAIAAFEARAEKQLDPLLPVVGKLAERDDGIGRLARRRLRKLKDEDRSFLDKVAVIERLVGRLKGNEEAGVIAGEIGTLARGIQAIEKRSESLVELKASLAKLLGPAPGVQRPVLPRLQYGQTRWEHAQERLHEVLYEERWVYDEGKMGRKVFEPRVVHFKGTEIEPLFAYAEEHFEEMLRPRWTFYWGFLTDKPLDIHIFGGLFPELLGTIFLTLGAILFALPIGIIAAIYFTEYARPGKLISLLRTCVSTLAGVPSIVFGMFGLAFFLNTCHMPKSVLAGSLTLALVILPTIIRASEEAIRAVPNTYREAALGLGAGRWRTIVTVILPSALPGILTGSVISMGRAAGETAPIIFTAAASVAATLPLNPLAAWDQPTAALSWNIYNLCTEHEAANEIRHVQFGMTATLITVVLLLNLVAIIMRARISRKLKG